MRRTINRRLTTHRWNSASPSATLQPLCIYKYTYGNTHMQVYGPLLENFTYHFMGEYCSSVIKMDYITLCTQMYHLMHV